MSRQQLNIKDTVVYVPVRMSLDLRQRILKLAERENNSMNRQIVKLIEAGYIELT